MLHKHDETRMLNGQTIIFLPGLDGTGISAEPLAGILPHDVDMHVVRYPTNRCLGFAELLQCARHQAEPVKKDAIIIAESFSGPVAVALVASGQVKAKCLVLCATFARSPRPGLWKALSWPPVATLSRLPWPRWLLKHVIEGGEEATDLFLYMWRKIKAQVPSRIFAHRLELLSRVDVRLWLPRLTVPCLYIQAASDRSVPASALFDFMEQVSDLRVRRINGPHFILQMRPRECLAAIGDFVGSL